MERFVVSRELAQKLKDAGYQKRSTILVWWRVVDSKRKNKQEWFLAKRTPMLEIKPYEILAAPMSDELLEKIPNVNDERLTVWKLLSGGYSAEIPIKDGYYEAAKPVDALAQLWLGLKANGHLVDKEDDHAN